MHQTGARGRSESGGPWRRFVIAWCSMQRISDRRPSAVPESKYPRDALYTPDVESPLVRSTLSMRPDDLAARPPASFDDPISWETANRRCPPTRRRVRCRADSPDVALPATGVGELRPQFPDTPRALGRIRAARGPYQRVDRRGSPTLAAIDLSSVRNTTKIRPTRPSLLGWLGVANTWSLEPAPPPRAVRCGAAAAVASVAPM